MLLHSKLICVAGIALLAALATPAVAGTLFKWTAEDGSVAFTDDPKRVPERYRSQVKTIETGGLDTYERFTPSDSAQQSDQQKRLQERLERLRALNRPAPTIAVPAPGVQPYLIIKTDERTALTIPNGAQGEAPVVVEEMRVRDPNSIATRHVTVVRQGDRVLSVVKPASPAQSVDPPSEAEFESP
jgi:hypothetical protein